jgi:hypothetical protein
MQVKNRDVRGQNHDFEGNKRHGNHLEAIIGENTWVAGLSCSLLALVIVRQLLLSLTYGRPNFSYRDSITDGGLHWLLMAIIPSIGKVETGKVNWWPA